MASPRKPGLRLKINKVAFTRKVKKRIEDNMDGIGALLVQQLAQAVSVPYPPASRVGESPHRRTGELQKSFKWIVKVGAVTVSLRVFTDNVYAARLEFGFIGTDSLGRNINQGPRPYWRPVLAKSRIGTFVAKDP
jgi:hypothetical protein